jgi:hypothetical protein
MANRPATLVDSCVLLDIITGDEQWADWSAAQLAAAIDAGWLVINPLIYAEVSVSYETIEELDELFPVSEYEREALPYLAGFAVGKAFCGTGATAATSDPRCPTSTLARTPLWLDADC